MKPIIKYDHDLDAFSLRIDTKPAKAEAICKNTFVLRHISETTLPEDNGISGFLIINIRSTLLEKERKSVAKDGAIVTYNPETDSLRVLFDGGTINNSTEEYTSKDIGVIYNLGLPVKTIGFHVYNFLEKIKKS